MVTGILNGFEPDSMLVRRVKDVLNKACQEPNLQQGCRHHTQHACDFAKQVPLAIEQMERTPAMHLHLPANEIYTLRARMSHGSYKLHPYQVSVCQTLIIANHLC